MTAFAAVAALALVAAGLLAVPEVPWGIASAVAAHLVHLAAAFAAGRAALRLPRASPREALDVVVSGLAPGLAVMALLSLTFATLSLARPWTPWAIDLICLLMGVVFGRLREAKERVGEPWLRRDMAVLAAPRLPLYVAVAVLGLIHLVPPLVPPSEATGASALPLPVQIAERGSLEAGLAAQPDEDATPSSALLLQGQLSGGDVGARLFGLTALMLAVAGTWLHARRHLGDRAAAWSCLALMSVPWLMIRAPRDPSFELQLAFGVLAFHEIADWCQHATGGKIGLASLYGGVLVAEGAHGAAVFAALLGFLFLVQALVDRHGVLAQVAGVAGMAALALLISTPFVALSASRSADPLASLARRYVVGSQDESPATAHAVDLRDVDSLPLIGAELARRALLAGPLLLGLLALLPSLPLPSEPLRRSVLAGLVAAAAAMAPAPYGGFAGMLGPAAVAAGGTAALLLSQRGLVARMSAAFALPALLVSVTMGLARGPDLALAARYLSGHVDARGYLVATVPDAALAEAVAERRDDETEILLVGDLTDALYGKARRPGDQPLDPESVGRLLVAVAPTGADPALLAELSTYSLVHDAGNGHRLLAPPKAP